MVEVQPSRWHLDCLKCQLLGNKAFVWFILVPHFPPIRELRSFRADYSGSTSENKMAKLFKHLGFGGKKTPPQPPKPDYSGLKQASLDSPTARSPTSEPGRASFSGTAGHIGDLESTQGSPQRTTVVEKVFGGARPKDSGGGDRNLLPPAASTDDGDGPAASETPAPKGASATPVSGLTARSGCQNNVNIAGLSQALWLSERTGERKLLYHTHAMMHRSTMVLAVILFSLN